MPYRAVLLDVDGTLVDSNDAHAHSWVEALAESGRRVDFLRARPLIGMGADKVLPALIGIAADSAEGEQIVRRRGEIFRTTYLPQLHPTRGAQRMLEWLCDDGLRLVVATSAKPEELEGLLQVADATRLIDSASSSADADRSKPDPDIVHAALVKANCKPEEAIFIGDTPYDIAAGNHLGVAVIALRCGGWWTDRSFQGAAAIYDDPDDLVEHYLLSPFKRPLALSR
jgi:phosphoglycolate phosphatase-like HAD superfamily hydrolase